MSRTISAKKKWLFFLQENCIGSSNKGASLLKMRRWWGADAYVVKCCGYLFQMEEETFKNLQKSF